MDEYYQNYNNYNNYNAPAVGNNVNRWEQRRMEDEYQDSREIKKAEIKEGIKANAKLYLQVQKKNCVNENRKGNGRSMKKFCLMMGIRIS